MQTFPTHLHRLVLFSRYCTWLMLLWFGSLPLLYGQAIEQSQLNFNGFSSINNGTALDWGPDDRLYVVEENGLVKVYTIQKVGSQNYEVTDAEVLTIRGQWHVAARGMSGFTLHVIHDVASAAPARAQWKRLISSASAANWLEPDFVIKPTRSLDRPATDDLTWAASPPGLSPPTLPVLRYPLGWITLPGLDKGSAQ